ncbi:hypothetical protein ACR82Z_02420 [Mycoplasma sp. 6243]|uniref:hypothetical protein n=1 Tax=Mycoplasma sp. 6243 TaxID=3440865 RepID=UPI003EB9D44C
MDNAFNEFLESINLDLYRTRYKNIKIMEADMQKKSKHLMLYIKFIDIIITYLILMIDI